MRHGVQRGAYDGERGDSPGAKRGGALKGLERLHLVMGEQCNARCTMCYQTDFSPKNNMPREIYAERLRPAYEQVRVVKLQGGEPTVMKNCRETAELLREYPWVRISMTTNGVRLEGFWLETMLAQGAQLDVSINAATEQSYDRIVHHGDYRRVTRNVKALTSARRESSPRVAISAVILKENVRELHRFVELGAELGVDAIRFGIDPILSFSGLPPDREIVAEIERVDAAHRRTGLPLIGFDGFRRRFVPTAGAAHPAGAGPCDVPDYNLVVDANGDVRGCVRTWQPIGNLYESSIEEIWTGEPALGLRDALATGDHSGCEPWCPENRNPSRFSLLRKYATYASKDPAFFAKKLQQKLVQLGRKAG